MILWPLAWLVVAALYLVLAGTPSAEEVTAAALAGLAGAGWAFAAQRRARPMSLDLADARVLARGAARLPLACAQVAGRLCAGLFSGKAGRVVERPFEPGPLDDRRAAGRRAAAVLGASLAPDSFVVRLDRSGGALRSHVLRRDASGSAR